MSQGRHVAGRGGTEMSGTSRRRHTSRPRPGDVCIYPTYMRGKCRHRPGRGLSRGGMHEGTWSSARPPHVTVTFPPSSSRTSPSAAVEGAAVELYRRIGTVRLHRRLGASRCGAFIGHRPTKLHRHPRRSAPSPLLTDPAISEAASACPGRLRDCRVPCPIGKTSHPIAIPYFVTRLCATVLPFHLLVS
jgi:hypothetical protein